MTRSVFKLLICFSLVNVSLLLNVVANATTLAYLYEVSIPVFSQSDKERKEATKKAFEELLVRITGQREIVASEPGQALLSQSRRYVRSFRYELLPPEVEFERQRTATQPSTEAEALDEDDEIEKPQQQLVVSFDEAAVKNSLWKRKLPVWGKTRPSTLFWVAIQDHDQRKMLDASKLSETLMLIKSYAEKRGVPVIYPELDVVDQRNINVTDVWGGFKSPLLGASERYKADAIISAQLLLDQNNVWKTQWHLYQTGDESSWQLSAPDLSVVIDESIDKLASALADRYAQVASSDDQNQFYINISDVMNLEDYEKINRYLKSLAAVKRVELAQIQSTELIYELKLRSNPKALKQAIALGKTLSTQDDPFSADVENNRLNYRLNP